MSQGVTQVFPDVRYRDSDDCSVVAEKETSNGGLQWMSLDTILVRCLQPRSEKRDRA